MSRWTLPGFVLLGAAVGGAAVWAIDQARDGSQAHIETVVHAYLLRQPDVIPEAMGKLQERETANAVATLRPQVVTPIGNAWEGNPRGDVTLVEYYDYNCGYCRASLPTIAQLIASDPGVRVVYQEMPVLAASSRDAARLSLLAARQGKFPAFHKAAYAGGPVTAASLAAAAASAGVDTRALPAQTASADDTIRTNLAIAQRLGMTGTPSWVIGDRVLSGAMPLDQMQAAVKAARGQRS